MKKRRERDGEPEGGRSVKYLPLRVHSVPITSTESGVEMQAFTPTHTAQLTGIKHQYCEREEAL